MLVSQQLRPIRYIDFVAIEEHFVDFSDPRLFSLLQNHDILDIKDFPEVESFLPIPGDADCLVPLLHKLLRESVTNTMVHADYNGRQGIVITKDADGFVFANPGRLRIPISEAVSGGVSDPRNGTMLKMFSLIRFGERAGSGLNGIMHVWKKVFHTDAHIYEKEGDIDRTILSLPFGGHEQDVKAMLQFYDNPGEYSEEDFVSPDKSMAAKEGADEKEMRDGDNASMGLQRGFTEGVYRGGLQGAYRGGAECRQLVA